MRWTVEFPVQVYASPDDSGELEPVCASTAPMSVRNAIAEACWSLGQALSRTTHQLTVVAVIDEPTTMEEEERDGKKRR